MTKKKIPSFNTEEKIRKVLETIKKDIEAHKYLSQIPWLKKELKKEPNLVDYEKLIKKIENLL